MKKTYMTGSQCHGSTQHHVNCVWVGFISISDKIQHLFLWRLAELTFDNKFPIKWTVKNKQKRTSYKTERTCSTIIKKKLFHYKCFHVLMFYPRNIPQMLTQVPCLVVSNFREQLFGFPVTVLKNLHILLKMDEGRLLTN